MSITIKQYDGITVSPKDDALMYDIMMAGQAGKFNGLAVTSLGANQIHISAGRLIVKGREIVIDEETVNVALSSSGTKLGQLYLHIDLSNTTTPAEWVSEAVTTLTTLTQDSTINYDNGIWDVQFCTYSVSETAVSNLVVTLGTITSPGEIQHHATFPAASFTAATVTNSDGTTATEFKCTVAVSGITETTLLKDLEYHPVGVPDTDETTKSIYGTIVSYESGSGTVSVYMNAAPSADIILWFAGKETA